MKVYIYDQLAHVNPKSGMGLYTAEIIKHLQKNKTIKYVLFRYDYKNKPNNLVNKILGVLGEHLYIQLKSPQIFERMGDLVYFPNPPVSFLTGTRVVLTIPDLSFYYDRSFNLLTKFYLFVMYFFSAHKAKFITTFSENSKNDIVNLLKIKKEKVSIVTPALKDNYLKFIKKGKSAKVLKKYKIKKNFILAVPGTYVPRKNMKDLVDAFLDLPQKIQGGYNIVSVGKIGDKYFEEFENYCKGKKLLKKMFFLSQIPDEDEVQLYKNATVFVFPSLYEGFGLPPLEALASGCPVICYRNSSLPEVLGNSVKFVDNKRQLTQSLKVYLTDKDSSKKMTRKGLTRYKLFSWEKSADKLTKIFMEALNWQ